MHTSAMGYNEDERKIVRCYTYRMSQHCQYGVMLIHVLKKQGSQVYLYRNN